MFLIPGAFDAAVKDRIVEALDQLYITGWVGNTFTSAQAARNLIDLASGATLGELGSLEVIVKEFMDKGFLTPVTLHELWEIAGKAALASAIDVQGAGKARKDLRAAMAVISMAAATSPDAFAEEHVRMMLQYGFAAGNGAADALTTRNACVALQRLAPQFECGAYDAVRDQAYAVLTRTVVASPFSEESWFTAAEAAVSALYVLHPTPEHICCAIVRCLAMSAFAYSSTEQTPAPLDHNDDGSEDTRATAGDASYIEEDVSSVPITGLSRFFFVLGHVALEQLVYIERQAKAVRCARMDAEKRAAEEKATKKKGKDDEDINAELGVGSVAADAELDAMKDASEGQILAVRNLLGPYARIISTVCHNRSLLFSHPILRSSALLALSKLMVVDARFCEANLQLLFTLLQNRSIEAPLRCNLVIAIGDLALRFPNLLEPWTDHIYRPLGDPDAKVRKNAMMVLTHLILNDMMKVKGHIAKMAVCLEDGDDRIAALAQLFFHELAKKEYKGTSPIYNLLPDILSNLSRETGLTRPQFQSVMQQLLGYIKKDKQGDALVEKLCQRFAATEDTAQWRNIAFCLAQLPLSEKGIKKLAECFKLYKTALADSEVTQVICGTILAKAKKNAGKPEMKQMVEDLEAKIEACAAERAEEEEAAAAAAERAKQDRMAREEGQGGDEAVEGMDTTADSEDGQQGSAMHGDGDDGMVRVKEEPEESTTEAIEDESMSRISLQQAFKARSSRSAQQERKGKAAARKGPTLRRGGRRAKASTLDDDDIDDGSVDSDYDNEEKIAAVQAGIERVVLE